MGNCGGIAAATVVVVRGVVTPLGGDCGCSRGGDNGDNDGGDNGGGGNDDNGGNDGGGNGGRIATQRNSPSP